MKRVYILLAMGFGLIGCGGGGGDTTNVDSTNTTITLASSYQPDDGRLLASGCFQCHGTNGYSTTDWDSIAGEDELHEEMFESDGIMRTQADGFSDSEITAMQDYLSKLAKSDDD